MEPTTPTPATDDPSATGGGPPWAAIAIGVLAAVLALVLVVVLTTGDDDEDVTAETTTTVVEDTTTTEGPTTTADTTTTTSATTTSSPGQVGDAEAATIIWPAPGDGEAEALGAVGSFAEDLLGFVDPVYGEYQGGDSRSGEIEVRPTADGPVTTVGVRQMGDDRWYVVVAATSEVELIRPLAGSAVDHPQEVEGWGRGFEGQVRVAVFVRGETTPLGETTVMASSGGEVAPFTGSVDWPDRGTGGWGVVTATVAGGPDGATWAGTAIPVGFIGGD